MKSLMVLFFLLVVATIGIFVTFETFAEPVSREEFMKTYQPKLDRVQDENLPPIKQSEIGIRFNDILCHDNKIHVLKLTGENYIACVTLASAEKLVERSWGIIHREDPHSGTAGAECIKWWMIHHHDDSIPLKSSLIKTIRETTNEFANESIVWKPIKLVEHKDNIITLSSYGNFREEYIDQVAANLLNIKHVTNIEFEPRACI